ncbi:hypothetical protein Phi10:1_gp041 [Cellulophaga phage phi10:1]|uniref:Uncharacterized protein n=1 Tax=Cellulophaga phage phi10:1 TaxID=1327981 RepID=S0A1L6_9CAUD|nr:hypothetical protein Phi10:1_gp041 [Cellulophaga phage phi10:1]AGO48382.1 hypothetical protein Phi10:1_gp041 [Cellulophaga phage phi10:1]
MECNYKNHADNIWSMGECASCGETCNHEWIVNTHQNTKYCRNNCDEFKEHKYK